MQQTLTFQEAEYSMREYSREILELSIMWMLMGRKEKIRTWIKRKTWNNRNLGIRTKNLKLGKEFELLKQRVLHCNLKHSQGDMFRGLGAELA